MSQVPKFVDFFLVGSGPSVLSHPNRTVLRNLSLRCLLSLTLLWTAACDSLWTDFKGPNPINCVATPGICTASEICDLQTRLCKLAALSLVAGKIGNAGNVNDTRANALFNQPSGVAADDAGNLYIADYNNHTIRKVVMNTGAVITLAGMAGSLGFVDGTGTAARFNNPFGVVADGAGNLYVADRSNNLIRKVVMNTGAVTTLAGMAPNSGNTNAIGTAARFAFPYAVAADTSGNLYVADTANHTIRKVVMNTVAVTTLAGTAGILGSADGTGAAARFNTPYSVAADGAGNLYVADTANHTIRQVVIDTGAVTTLAGTAGSSGNADGTGAAARFNTPSGVAADGAGNLYVADTGNHTIRRIELAHASVTTIAGIAGQAGVKLVMPARLDTPRGIAVLPTGEIIIAESGANAILSIY